MLGVGTRPTQHPGSKSPDWRLNLREGGATREEKKNCYVGADKPNKPHHVDSGKVPNNSRTFGGRSH